MRLAWSVYRWLSWKRSNIALSLFGQASGWQFCRLCIRPGWRVPMHCEYLLPDPRAPRGLYYSQGSVCEQCCDRLGLRTMLCPRCSPIGDDAWVFLVHEFYRTGQYGRLAA